MKTSPALFVRQVKQEISKITWPTRSEAMQGTLMVIVMSVMIALFLFLIDLVFAYTIRLIVG
ncbi:MAG: preprotein translocase subunit SecE [Alphaproteobacteria bacterium]|nr:preprotein translocase subunit SecE [Alphaproteobacteria bacterium]